MKTPEEYHRSEHRPDVSFEDCWNCGRAKAQCRAKVKWTDQWLAWDRAKELNEERRYETPIRVYRCRWCLCWHFTSSFRSNAEAARAEKQRRKWLTRMEMERRQHEQAQDL
jgi:hypothetical protein